MQYNEPTLNRINNARHGGENMRLKKEQIEKVAEKVLADLDTAGLVSLKGDRTKILDAIRTVITNDIKSEDDLEAEAELILDRTLRAAGGGADIDRHKMLKMIKDKLAKERKIVL
jgi:hypothetical protein